MSTGCDETRRRRGDDSLDVPVRQIRAQFDERTIRVYQAYSDEIAEAAIATQTFKPPFKRARMTWIKPSFAWMMYRSGWSTKAGQERILGIDILRTGFEWALTHSSISNFDPTIHSNIEEWRKLIGQSPVRLQWDPERTISLEGLPWRTIQVGLGGLAVDAYIDEWIVRIDDVTSLAHEIDKLVARRELDAANLRRPVERPYPLPRELASRIGCTVIGDG